MGLQGAGKSSFCRKFFSRDHEVVSKEKMGKRKHKQLKQERLLRQLLSENKPVIVDNMNLTKENRRALINIAREFKVPVKLYYFPITIGESFERNEGPNRHKVPAVAIYAAQTALEKPTIDEGFDSIYIVRMISPENFSIEGPEEKAA